MRAKAGWLLTRRLISFLLPAGARKRSPSIQARKEERSAAEVVLRRTAKLRRAGKFKEALAIYERAPADVSKNAKFLRERAGLLAEVGDLSAAYQAFLDALAVDPDNAGAWRQAGLLLERLGREEEVPALIGRMLTSLARTSETLIKAATIATDARAHDLADKLIDEALSPAAAPTADAVLKIARILLKQGEQGRVVRLFESPPPSAGELGGQARELKGLALAQLRLAGGNASRPVGMHARADVIAVQSILARMDRPPADIHRAPRGLAILSNSLAPGGSETQVIRLVRQLCGAANEFDGPIVLLLGTRSSVAPDFHASNLTGLNVTVECLSDFDLDVTSAVPPAIAGQMSVLPRRMFARTAALIGRLRTHRPQAVLAMSETNGLAAALAAAIVGVPRVVVSVRGEPPPAWGLRDGLLRPAYRGALAENRLALVANGVATARAFAQWLDQSTERIGTIYNGIDVDELRSQRDPGATAAHRRALGIPDGARVVGSVFSARPGKRPRLWVEAAAIIARRAPDVVFVVVGADHRQTFPALVTQEELRGRFHRPGVRQDVPTWLDLMDVVLLTSLNEGTPNVLIEAQALGRPVVATAVASTAETFLPGQTGILLPANPTPDAIADAVLRVLGDPGFANRAGELAPPFIRQRFCVKRMAAEFVDICLGSETAPGAAAIAGTNGR
jgi:glycosyltransferase involved in cell wall biosynthesis